MLLKKTSGSNSKTAKHEIKEEIRKCLEERKMKTQPKIYSKSSSKREVHNNTGLPRKKKRKKNKKKNLK